MRTLVTIALLGLALGASGCATLVGGGSSQSVTFESAPSSATVVVQSAAGLEMGSVTAPGTLSLPRKHDYQIRVSLDGYQSRTTAITRGTNGWIWGNLFVGWLVGFGIDFLTGSAYELQPSLVRVTLEEEGGRTFAVVQFLDSEARPLGERRLEMIPE